MKLKAGGLSGLSPDTVSGSLSFDGIIEMHGWLLVPVVKIRRNPPNTDMECTRMKESSYMYMYIHSEHATWARAVVCVWCVLSAVARELVLGGPASEARVECTFSANDAAYLPLPS